MIIDRGQLAAALPGYELRDQLGAGHFGLVLAGRHRRLERDVAIKVLAVADEGADDRFTTEARLLARMDHSHIVRVYDYVEYDGLHLIIMELLSGGSLSQRLAGISPKRAYAVGIAVAEALSYAHAQGVLHRDIKPGNVLFDAGDVVKVTDFGIAKIFDGSATTASAVAGTPAYMAPEQIIGGQLGPTTDIYALGVVLYEMLAGTLPFDPGLPLLKRYEQQLTTTPVPPVGVPPAMANVVMHALASEIRARPPSAQAFVTELTAAIDQGYGQSSIRYSAGRVGGSTDMAPGGDDAEATRTAYDRSRRSAEPRNQVPTAPSGAPSGRLSSGHSQPYRAKPPRKPATSRRKPRSSDAITGGFFALLGGLLWTGLTLKFAIHQGQWEKFFSNPPTWELFQLVFSSFLWFAGLLVILENLFMKGPTR